jgi:hypothetical protein
MKFLKTTDMGPADLPFIPATAPKKQKNKKKKPPLQEQVAADSREIWTKEQAKEWYATQGWLVGADFLPSTAINQLEMFQEESFDTATIDKELGWAQKLA